MRQPLSIEESTKNKFHLPTFSLFELGFRPFFLLGAIFALLSIIQWGLILNSAIKSPTLSIWWHAHEMIFGFSLAIIYGFLLTAGQNWTAVPAPRGTFLLTLVMLWLLPRLGLVLSPSSPMLVWAVCDILLNVAVMLIMARMILKAKQWRNMPFIIILTSFALLNGASYFTQMSDRLDISMRIHDASLWLIAIVINIIGGRVIPFFTQNATPFKRITEPVWLFSATSIGLMLMAFAWLFDVPVALRIFSAITAMLLLYRWSMWGWRFSFKNPLLWSLHLSFVCLPIACGLIALDYSKSSTLHLLTIGSIAGLILSMMSRVSLGHTGRALKSPKLMPYAFSLIAGSALLRALAGFWSDAYLYLINVALFMWVLAFTFFVYHYTIILIQPRLDGKRG